MNQKITTLEDILDTIQKFNLDREWDQFHNPKDLAIGIITEAAELLDIFRFIQPDQLDRVLQEKRSEIEDELIDVLYFVLRFAQKNQIDLYEAFERKMQKNNEKYPIDKARGNNEKYTDYQKTE